MICRVCNRDVDFVPGKRGNRSRITCMHKVPNQGGLNDKLISSGYRRQLRRELEDICRRTRTTKKRASRQQA